MKKQLNKSDVEKINGEIFQQLGVADFFGKKDQLLLVDQEHILLIVKEKVPLFFYIDGKIVPSLKLLLAKQILKQVVVDMGAVKFVSQGADIMRPGIVDLNHEIKKDEFVAIVDQNHEKPLCVAQAILSGEEIFRLQKGKVFKNIHWVGDAIWKLSDSMNFY